MGSILILVRLDARVQGRPRVGEVRSGDAALVHPAGDTTWVVLVDALGHGPKAADAAELAIAEASTFDANLAVEQALARIHERLRGSRGAAATIAHFDARGATFGGVGNVEARTLRGTELPFAPSSGVLGGRTRRFQSVRIDLAPRTRLLFYTDGITRRAPFESFAELDGTLVCNALLMNHSHPHDDATVIHVTFLPQR